MLRGSVGFAGVSLAGFSVWALAGKWFYTNLGEVGLYTVCLLVFLGSSGLLLHPLVRGPGALIRFYRIFVPAFVAYAIAWCGAWFILRFGFGEWLGSLAGSIAFVAVVGLGFGHHRGLVRTSIVVFALHSAGYFLGGQLMQWVAGPPGAAILAGLSKAHLWILAALAWGAVYGLGFGAGIGYVFFSFRNAGNTQPTPTV